MADNRMCIVNHDAEAYVCIGKSYGCDWSFNCDELMEAFFKHYSIYGRCDDIGIMFESEDQYDTIVRDYECYNTIFYKHITK